MVAQLIKAHQRILNVRQLAISEYRPGQRVSALWDAGGIGYTFYPARVTAVYSGKLHIRFDDGMEQDVFDSSRIKPE